MTYQTFLTVLAAGWMACAPPLALAQDTPAPAPADSSASPAPAPTCDEPVYHAFDFWLGEWDVTSPDGSQAYGSNAITALSGGCALLERWTPVQGVGGESLNYYDPGADVWRQYWVSRGFIIDIAGGPTSGQADLAVIDMTGFIVYRGTGVRAPFRGRWHRTEDGSVIQKFWQLDPATGEWSVWFEGLYRRRR